MSKSRVPRPDGFVPFERAAIEQSIPRRFAQQVAAGPDRTAVAMGPDALTYAQLDAWASRVAHAVLAARGDRLEPVACVVEQGLALIATILGVLKAGKMYVPLEAAHPRDRLAYLLHDCAAPLALVDGAAAPLLREIGGAALRVIAVGDLDGDLPDGPSPVDVEATTPAYIYYTTGSTGRPKGVVDSHRNVLHNVMRYTNGLGLTRDDRLTLLQSPSFSGAVSSMFCALLNGATSLPWDVRASSAAELADYVDDAGVTVYHSVPTIFRSFLRGARVFPRVRIVRLEGDRAAMLDVELFRRHFAPTCVLANGLGATETGIVRRFLADRETPLPGGIVPIGYPVEDMEVSVLDDDGQPAPSGTVGEIAVRSEYLALGYWNRPDLTERAFTADTEHPASRVYRTGDLGRLREDGCLEHLGRKDLRTKIRGVPVAIAEVEAALAGLPSMREVAVTARATAGEERRLIAYYVPAPGAEPTVSEIRRHLAERLPPQMIPAAYVAVGRLPLNENLKVDRGALPAPSRARPRLDTAYAGPEDPTQAELVRVWQELLQVEPIGIRDDFFELGGDSLLAAAMLAAVEEVVGRRVPATILLAGSTVEEVAASLSSQETAAREVVPVHPGGSKPPLYFLHGDYLGRGVYCRKIARALGAEQPFFALTPCGLDGERAPSTIELMATRHLRALRAHQPRGPYRLAGNCNGGLVAFEMARRLIASGEVVDRLIVIRTSGANARFSGVRAGVEHAGRRLGVPADAQRALVRRVRWFAAAWAERGPVRRAALALEKVAKLAGLLAPRRRPTAESPAAGPLAERDALIATFMTAADDYVPLPYAGPLTVLWPAEEAEPAADALRAWRRVSPRVEIETIPGDHLSAITAHADALAERLARCLGDG